jgi:hypothetical protein
MRIQLTALLALAEVLIPGSFQSTPARGAPPRDAPDLSTFETVVAPLFRARCVRCHGPREHKEGLRLDRIDPALAAGQERSRWTEIRDRLKNGEMPPKGEPRPSSADVTRVVAWIDGELAKADQQGPVAPGRVALRRLNRAEYANTIRDLLHVEFPFGGGPLDLLPPDGTAGGFDKVGTALMVDAALMNQYLAVARRVADAAIVTGPRPLTRRNRFEYEDTARSAAIGYECNEPNVICRPADLVLMEGDARTWDQPRLDPTQETAIPADGVYTIRLRMSADLGARGEPLTVRLVWPSVIAEWTLTRSNAAPQVFEITLPIKVADKTREGPQVSLVNGTKFFVFNELYGALNDEAERAGESGDAVKAEKLRARAKAEGAPSQSSLNPAVYDRATLPKLFLDWIELEGPIVGEWPPASQREVFFEGRSGTADMAYARRIFQRLLPRAYRRPVPAAELDAVVARVGRELAAGESFEEAIKVGLQYVLCSPRFLYLVEAGTDAPLRPLDDHALASRLSYFLWNSMPDDALLARAAQGQLRTPGVLDREVRRMLHDPKARALVDGFAAEWLQAQKFVAIAPNRQIYRDWDDELEAAAKAEPLAFFEEVLHHDLSALNFLDSDFAMLNERLARHYGIPGVAGKELRPVKLPPGAHRGGLVTQTGILTIGSDGTRTLPVRRASWVLQTLFDSPPPPPPPNVREVEPNVKGAALTVRQRLIQHQKVAACAGCHVKIDPYGLGLESYDAVGLWREHQNGEEFAKAGEGAPLIDASGTLPDGRSFQTTAQFRALLRGEQERFSRALTSKLLTYALGRKLEAVDAGQVGALTAAFQKSGHRLSALIAAIANSQAFQTK